MRVERAIEILLNHQADMPRADVPDLISAIKLGIEALKRLKEHREHHIDITYRALPGETSPSNPVGAAGDS